MKTLSFAMLFLLVSFPIRVWGSYCEEAKSTVEINACLENVYKKVDKALNAEYQRVLQAIGTTTDYPEGYFKDTEFKTVENFYQAWKKDFREAQRKWVQFKEADCGLTVYSWWGGTGATSAQLACLIDKTERRLQELKQVSK